MSLSISDNRKCMTLMSKIQERSKIKKVRFVIKVSILTAAVIRVDSVERSQARWKSSSLEDV